MSVCMLWHCSPDVYCINIESTGDIITVRTVSDFVSRQNYVSWCTVNLIHHTEVLQYMELTAQHKCFVVLKHIL